MEKIINVILWAALIQGLFLALLYIFSKKNKSFANFLLGMFLISIILEAFTTILPFNFIGNYSISGYFTLPEVKLFIPLFFVHYVLEKLGKSKRYSRFLKINYIIACLISAITIVNLALFFFLSSTLQISLGEFALDKLHLSLQTYAFIIVIAAFLIAIYETLRYRKVVQNEYSDYSMLQINWLWQFIFILLPAAILWGIELVSILITGSGSYDFVLIAWGFVAIFLYFLSYKAYRNQNLFEEFPKSTLSSGSNSAKIRVEPSCDPSVSRRIENLMKDNRYYLNTDLTIHNFAKEIDMSPRLISNCINRNFGFNFNEWVNNFRVEEALIRLNSDSQNAFSIEGIGFECGFRSRSAMYAAFDKKIGQSPGHFRKK